MYSHVSISCSHITKLPFYDVHINQSRSTNFMKRGNVYFLWLISVTLIKHALPLAFWLHIFSPTFALWLNLYSRLFLFSVYQSPRTISLITSLSNTIFLNANHFQICMSSPDFWAESQVYTSRHLANIFNQMSHQHFWCYRIRHLSQTSNSCLPCLTDGISNHFRPHWPN